MRRFFEIFTESPVAEIVSLAGAAAVLVFARQLILFSTRLCQ